MGRRPATGSLTSDRPAGEPGLLVAVTVLVVLYFVVDVRSTTNHSIRWLEGSPVPVGLSSLADDVLMERPEPALAGLFSWARTRTPPDVLFAVPPVDRRFVKFRLAAERGVYAAVHDVNQLAFDKSVYALAHQRLIALGVGVLGRHQFGEAGYYSLPPERYTQLASAGVDYIAFDRSRLVQAPSLPVAYEDASVVVFVLTPER